MKHIVLGITLFALVGGVGALTRAHVQTTTSPAPARPTPPKPGPEHAQFDFWIGEWNVTTPDGKLAGTNRIERILDGFVLRETWTGSGGRSGTSLNAYSAADGKWHQTWVDDQGTVLLLEGGLEQGKMVLRASVPSSAEPGKAVLHRVTWSPLDGGRVRQHWESSTNGGKGWTTVFDGTYAPKR